MRFCEAGLSALNSFVDRKPNYQQYPLAASYSELVETVYTNERNESSMCLGWLRNNESNEVIYRTSYAVGNERIKR